MNSALSEMSLEDLWQLFPIILKEHNPLYSEWYAHEKTELKKIIEIKRINHVGSTAVNGLIAKPIVDILLEIDNDCDIENLKTKLCNAGWLLMSEETNPILKLSYNKGYTPNGFADKVFHLHVRYVGDWDELYFRDYLIEHKHIAADYGELKLKLEEQYKHNRDEYTNAKTDFIVKHSKFAREKYKDKIMNEIEEVRKALLNSVDAKSLASSDRFFKQGEAAKVYGVKASEVHKIAKSSLRQVKEYPKHIIFEMCEELWKSGYLEESGVACTWSESQQKKYEPADFAVFERWLSNYVSNWAQCDTLCRHTIGSFVMRYPDHIQMKVIRYDIKKIT